VVLNTLKISRHSAQLEDALKYADRNLESQRKQCDLLTSHMEEIRRARHDLRQHCFLQALFAQSCKKFL